MADSANDCQWWTRTPHGGRRAATRPLRTLAVVLAALAALLALPLPVAGQMTSTEVVLTVAPAVVSEGAGATELTVTGTLDGDALMQETEVALSVRAGSATEHYDYTAGTATLTIAESQTSGTAALTLTPLDEHLYQRFSPRAGRDGDGGRHGRRPDRAGGAGDDHRQRPAAGHPPHAGGGVRDDRRLVRGNDGGKGVSRRRREGTCHETNAGYDAAMATGALRPDSFELGGVSYTVDLLYGAATSTMMIRLLVRPDLPEPAEPAGG